MSYKKDWLKFFIGWLWCFIVRLNSFRLPNVEPILATQMPFSKRFGGRGGFIFGFISILIYDLVTRKLGSWTLITGATYGLLGVGAHHFFKSRKANRLNFLKYGVLATIVYDVVTGLSVGMLVFKQSFLVTVTGQIPFTARHLLGNILLSLALSPLINKWVVENKNLATDVIWAKLLRTV